MKRIFDLKFIIILCLLLLPYTAAAADDFDNYSTGLIWDSPESMAEHLLEEPPVESVLPSSVDLTETFPSPGNQGAQASCTAWAVAYALASHQEEVKREWGLDTDEHLMSPAYVYNQICGGEDNGSSIIQAMRLIINQGVCPLSSFPYNANDYLTQPNDGQKARAAYFKAKEWYWIKGRDNIKRHLAEGDGVIIGINVYSDFRRISPSNPVYDVVSGIQGTGHSICLIGYDDEKSAFKFINSWGKSWGLDGYGWISYEMLDNTSVSQHGASVGFVMEPNEAVYHENAFDYTISDGGAKIIKYYGANDDLVIPDILGGHIVTEIGSSAFSGCTSLKSVVIPDSVVNIGSGAFFNCKSLTDVSIGSGVKALAESMFNYCDRLNNISVSNGNESYADIDGVLFDKSISTLILYPKGRQGGYIVPQGVTEIASYAFINCDKLTDIKMPNSLVTIGDWVFWFCTGLTDVIIPDGTEYIGDGAFRFTGAKTITVPKSVTYIAEEAFDSPYIPPFEAYATIRCYENSCAHKHAVDMDIPFEIIDRGMKVIGANTVLNDEKIIVNHLILTNTEDGVYELTADFEKEGDVHIFAAVYDNGVLKKAYAGDGKAGVKGIYEQDLANCKIFIWNKHMQPCIETAFLH